MLCFGKMGELPRYGSYMHDFSYTSSASLLQSSRMFFFFFFPARSFANLQSQCGVSRPLIPPLNPFLPPNGEKKGRVRNKKPFAGELSRCPDVLSSVVALHGLSLGASLMPTCMVRTTDWLYTPIHTYTYTSLQSARWKVPTRFSQASIPLSLLLWSHFKALLHKKYIIKCIVKIRIMRLNNKRRITFH